MPALVNADVVYVTVPFEASAWALTVVPPQVVATPPQFVPPSTWSVTVPVGTVDPLVEATVIVKVTLAPGAGFAGVPDTVVEVAIMVADVPVFGGHNGARRLRSTEPRPVTSS